MNKISKMISGFAMLALMLSFFAFKSDNAKRATVYFEYQSSAYNDTAYETPGNWDYISGTPSTCLGESHICVLRIDSDLLTSSGTPEEQLTDYLSSLPDATDFVENDINIEYKKN